MNYKLEKNELEQIGSYLKNEKIIGITDIFNKHTVIVLFFAIVMIVIGISVKITGHFVLKLVYLIVLFAGYVYIIVGFVKISKLTISENRKSYKTVVSSFFDETCRNEKFYNECFKPLYEKDRKCFNDFNEFLEQVISEKNKNNERIFRGVQVAGSLSCIYLLSETLSKLKATGFHSEYEIVTLLLPFVFYIVSVIEQKKLNRLQTIKKMIDDSVKEYNSES